MAKAGNNNSNQKSRITLLSCILIILILILISVIAIVNVNKNNDGNNDDNTNNSDIIYNENDDVIGDKVIDNITFTNIECSFDGFRSTLKYTITNNGNKTINLIDYELVIKNDKDEILAIMVPGILKDLKPGDTINASNIIDIDLSTVASLNLRKSN